MLKLLRSILSVDRKRRNLAVGFALWLLRLVRDIEKDKMDCYSDLHIVGQLNKWPELLSSNRQY